MPDEPKRLADAQPDPEAFVLKTAQRRALLAMLAEQPYKLVAPFIAMLSNLDPVEPAK